MMKMMKGFPTIASITLMALLAACAKEERTLTQKEIKAKADSIIATKLPSIEEQAAIDLDARISIEVKAKTDSIVDAYIKKQDSLTPAPANER
ncbi:hypothetical protein CAP35_11080 [Chitinophagaceae bacterium IBVUCB1]|nr:hypothetical protein CAP35_11080 [Chitinophagaceae bacterium IBVUCB1]